MTIRIYAVLVGLMSFSGLSALDFTGLSHTVIEDRPESSTGLETVYVLESGVGVTVGYTSRTTDVRWYRFSNLGGAYAEEMTPIRDGDRWSVSFGGEDTGYIIEDGTERHCYWIVNYANHRLDVEALTATPAEDCGRTLLTVDGDAEPISYYNINGRRMELSRRLRISYNTLRFDESSFVYVAEREEIELAGISGVTAITAPLCNTTFTLEGDCFLEAWDEGVSVESASYTTTAVEAESRAENLTEKADNEQGDGDSGTLGGSAPCTIRFEAAVTDAGIFTEWQISRTEEFEILENSYRELEFEYTFTESGKTYVRFLTNNADGTCEFAGTTYEIFIGESKLDIPNAFSPQASPGVNDEWKVSYKSLVRYECHIFNRWGKCLFSSTNPAEGWDGKSGGKYVPAGVYYYVIKAKGSDGVNYDRAGDINIVNFTGSGTSSGGTDTETE